MVENALAHPRRVFGFPHPVDEVSARLVAAGVLVQAVLIVATHWWPLYLLLVYGFLARVLTGPPASPLGLLVTRAVRPRLAVRPRYVPGPPKRFAQAIRLAFSTLIAVVALGLDRAGEADPLLLVLAAFCPDCEDVGPAR